MTPLGERFERDLDASVHVEPRRGRDTASRAAPRRRRAGGARVGGTRATRPPRRSRCRRACRAAGGGGAPRAGAAVVTPATPHGDTGERDPLVDRIDFVNVYSLHDAVVDPPTGVRPSRRLQRALRDEDTSGCCSGRRTRSSSRALADLAPHAAVS
jgi:hypothetical protein